jgi:hypothetical protein
VKFRSLSEVVVSCRTVLILLTCISMAPASAGPFDRMIGCWIGKSDAYTAEGQNLGRTSSHGRVYWKTPQTLIHFFEEQDKPSNPPCPPLDYDLHVNGSRISGGSADVTVNGVETNPRAYFFLLNVKSNNSCFQAGSWYNNHYFTGPHTRLVLGSFELSGHPDGVDIVAVQRLTRVPCKGKKR